MWSTAYIWYLVFDIWKKLVAWDEDFTGSCSQQSWEEDGICVCEITARFDAMLCRSGLNPSFQNGHRYVHISLSFSLSFIHVGQSGNNDYFVISFFHLFVPIRLLQAQGQLLNPIFDWMQLKFEIHCADINYFDRWIEHTAKLKRYDWSWIFRIKTKDDDRILVHMNKLMKQTKLTR